jgi:hypothetical protein
VGAGGSISNITYGQAYTVIASSASNCASIASLSFFVNDKFSCYPDINVAFVNQQVSGNLSTNDDLATGTVYGTASAVSGNPSGATLTMSNTGDGTYTFTATEPGVYNYTVEVCSIGQTPGQNPSQCASSVLTITVLDDGSITNPPVTNTDVAMVDGYAAAGTPTSVVINVLSNDFAGDLVGSLDPAEVKIINQPANGTVTVNNDGTITYVPDADFVGTDVFIYEVCDTKVPAECAEAMVEVTVTAPTATGVQAADDYVNTNGTAPVAGNLLDNDIDFATNGNSVLSVTPLVITNSDYTLTINADGSYVFEAEPGFDGPANLLHHGNQPYYL